MSTVVKSEPLNAGLYVRQSDRVDEGIAQQIEVLREKASTERWRVVDVYADNNTSASKVRGPNTDWARMLADIDAGRIQVVLAVTAARLLRRRVDVIELAKPRRSVRVVTLRDGIDTSTMGGRVMLDVLTGMAEEEIAEKEERATPYRAARRAAGHPSAGLVPYGYAWVPADRKDPGWRNRVRYAIVPDEAAALRYMSSELRGGADLGAIAAALNAGASDGEGNALPESTRLTRAGVRWTSTTVRRILVSPFPAALLPPPMPEGVSYRADRFTLSECTPGAWKAILSEDAVAAARGRLLNASRRSHDGNTRAKWLLTGLGKCGRCGGPLRMTMTKTTAQSARGYRCTAGCFQRPAALIEQYVESAAVSVLSAPGLLTWAEDDGADIEALRTRRDAIASTRTEWLQVAKAGKLSAAEWTEMSAGWEAELAQLDADIAEAVSVDPLAAFLGAEDVRALWDGLSVARRRAILGALLFAIRVHPVGKGRRVLTVEETEPTVTMDWKRAERRVKFDKARTPARVRPQVPLDDRETIFAALNV